MPCIDGRSDENRTSPDSGLCSNVGSMKHCPGCLCARERLSDDLPSSKLTNAGDWQLAHGLLYLAEESLKRKTARIKEAIGHDSPIHALVHLNDFGLSHRRDWRGIIKAQALDLEERLGW